MNRETLKAMLKRHEGWKLHPYRCTEKKLTIGCGWNIDANPLPDDIALYLTEHGEISAEMAERLLDISIDSAVHSAHRLFPGSMPSTIRARALVDLSG
jgi:lysozyme